MLFALTISFSFRPQKTYSPF